MHLLKIFHIFDDGDIYRTASQSTPSKLDTLHHAATRFATGAPFTIHHCDLYNLADCTSVHTRRLCHWLQLIYKTLLGKAPLYLSSLLHLSYSALNPRPSKFIKLTILTVRTIFGTPSDLLQLMTGTPYETPSNSLSSHLSLFLN